MDSNVKAEIELSAIINLIPYLDTRVVGEGQISLGYLVDNGSKFGLSNNKEFQALKKALETNKEYRAIQIVDQSSTNSSLAWTDDYIQGCTVKYGDDYYVAFRGTGDGRWADNGEGMTAASTEMQEAAREYFDKMAVEHLIDARANGGRVIVTGHSKGGNEAQYVFMASEYDYLIDKCYNIDGQGFSESAIEMFKKRFGPRYQDKLQDMYTLAGQNDYVHDLGILIVPEENTYFVETYGNGFENYHALPDMLVNEEGKYVGLSEGWETGKYEQGEIGKLAKEISKAMMKMDPEDLNGCAVAVMTIIEAAFAKDIGALFDGRIDELVMGNVEADWTDYVDLLAHGVPAVVETLLFTPEGQDILLDVISTATDYLNDKFGPLGVVAGYVVAAVVLTKIVMPLVGGIVVIANVIDFVVDAFDKIKEIYKDLKKFVSDFKDLVVKTVQKLKEKFRSWTAGGRYAENNPYVRLDTYKLKNYSQRLNSVNRRIINLDRRLDSLYWSVGLLDLWNLMQADALTGFSWRLLRCAGYLSETASDYESVESDLTKNI